MLGESLGSIIEARLHTSQVETPRSASSFGAGAVPFGAGARGQNYR